MSPLHGISLYKGTSFGTLFPVSPNLRRFSCGRVIPMNTATTAISPNTIAEIVHILLIIEALVLE